MKHSEHTVTFYQNPFYDEVLIFLLDKPVPPKQRKGKLQNRDFEAEIKKDLEELKKENWPYQGKVMVVFSVTGPSKYLENVDIDNVAKSILDVCKGILFADDRQVYSLIAEKHIKPEKSAFVLALRCLHDGEVASFVPPFYGESLDLWTEEHQNKFGKL